MELLKLRAAVAFVDAVALRRVGQWDFGEGFEFSTQPNGDGGLR